MVKYVLTLGLYRSKTVMANTMVVAATDEKEVKSNVSNTNIAATKATKIANKDNNPDPVTKSKKQTATFTATKKKEPTIKPINNKGTKKKKPVIKPINAKSTNKIIPTKKNSSASEQEEQQAAPVVEIEKKEGILTKVGKEILKITFKIVKNVVKVGQKIFQTIVTGYGFALIGYGYSLPTQIRIICIARVGGFYEVKKTAKALLKGVFEGSGTALLQAPSLFMATIAIANSGKRKKLAEQFQDEHKRALADGEISYEEYEELVAIQQKQIRMEKRAVRRLKGAKSFFVRTFQNLNLREIQNVFGDLTLMLTAIMASRQPSLLGNFIYKYYMIMNMGSLLLEVNHKLGYPCKNCMELCCLLMNELKVWYVMY